MNRLQYLASLIGIFIVSKAIATVIDDAAILAWGAWTAGIVPLTMYRFANMAKSPWWGLTAAIPVLAIMPVIMGLTWPPKAKEDSEDADEE